MKHQNIYDLIKDEETNYKLPVPIMEGYEWSMYEHIRTTTLYKNSQFTTGKDDNKPYKNIIRPILNLSYRAEGFDVKDILIYINDAYKYFKSFLIRKFHDKWARENDIDTFIDEMVESYVDYGGSLVKDVNNVRPEVVPWQRIAFVDQTDILSGPICEKHYYAPDQLKEMEKNGWKNIDEVIVLSSREQDTKKIDSMTGEKAKTPGKYIEIYEIHGVFPKYWLEDSSEYGGYYDENSDEMEYVRQIHICAFYQNESGKQGITLYKGKEKELPYKLILRDKIYGRALGIGGAEELFEPQVWVNYGMIHMKNMLDAASKIIFQTTDPAFANRNKIQNMDNLEITVTEPNTSISQVDTRPLNLAVFDNSVKEWEIHARQMGSAQEAIMGDQPPAGTPFKSVELQAIEGHSIHEYRKGKLATFLGEIYRDWIIPRMRKEVSKGSTFIAKLELDELQYVADALVTNEANKLVKEMILSGELVEPGMVDEFKKTVRENFLNGGDKKFIEIFKGEMDNDELDVEVNIAGKQKDLAGRVDKLVNIFRTVVSNPAILQSPPMAKLFNQILEHSGLSPVDFSGFTMPQEPAPQEQQQQPVPAFQGVTQ